MKIYRKCTSLLLVLVLLVSLAVPAAATEVLDFSSIPEYTVAANAALLLERSSGQVLYEQEADKVIYPASLTKIMTCFLALENGKLSDKITVSETAVANLDPAGSSAGLIAGEVLTLEQLLYCVMISSANEACNVVAEYVSGTTADFVELMNTRAAALGCDNTHFENPHGLHNENHYTTARDLSTIALAALEIPDFVTITSTTAYTVPATNLAPERNLLTTNWLVSTDTTSLYYYDKATGIKTGFTTPAGRCLISTAESDGLKLLSVVCGAATTVLDTGDLRLENFVETKSLFEFGFENYTFSTVLNALYPVAQVPVLSSSGAAAAVVSPSETIATLLPADYDETALEKEITIFSPDGVEAPIAQGDVLGTISLSYQGVDLGSTDLVAITDIGRSAVQAQVDDTTEFLEANGWPLAIGIFVAAVVGFVLFLLIRRRMIEKRRKALREKRRKVVPFRDEAE